MGHDHGPPPEMVAASDEGIVLTGDPVSVRLAVPESLGATVRTALVEGVVEGRSPRVYLSIEDLQAERMPGVIYGVFLDIPPDAPRESFASYHVGNIAPFGIEHVNDRDRDHEGDAGFSHVFDVTDRVRVLQASGSWDPASFTVTFRVIPPVPPPGQEALAAEIMEEQRAVAQSEPLRVGRISLFVG